jgi:ribonuclease HI
VADWTPPSCNLGGPDFIEPDAKALVFTEPHWTLFFDGSSCKQGARAGVMVHTLDEE